MKKYQLYIVGIVFLAVGIGAGWLLKPSASASPEEHIHETAGTSMEGEEYTCSMHPQIRQNEPGICPICEMDLVVMDQSMSNDDPAVLRMSKEAAKLAQIETFTVGGDQETRADNEQSTIIEVDGTIELDERTIKSQTAHLEGRIEEMSVTFEGQYVSAGQQIASIYSTQLLAASQELLSAAKYEERVEGLQNAAAQKLKNWKITDEQIQEILATGQPLTTINLYADHSGYVLDKKVSQGDYVKEGASLYTLGSTNSLWLIFNVFESDLANVQKGNKVSFTTPSVLNRSFESRISYIEPLLNNNTRTAVVRAEMYNQGNVLKPGMLLDGEIQIKTTKKSREDVKPVVVPSSSVLWTGRKSVVYVQLPETEVPSFEFREVEVGNQTAEYTTILKGLSQGDLVVSEGAFSIDAAAQLNNNFSMMNRDVKVKKEMASDAVPSYEEDTPEAFKKQLDETTAAYIEIKNALVETDAEKAKVASEQFESSLENMDMSLLKGEAHMYWMDQLNALEAHASKISESTNVEEQRNQFDFLSQAMINSLKAFGTKDETYFIQYCPMAKDNQGADWISMEKEIRNPYFGDKMMKCGTVKLELN